MVILPRAAVVAVTVAAVIVVVDICWLFVFVVVVACVCVCPTSKLWRPPPRPITNIFMCYVPVFVVIVVCVYIFCKLWRNLWGLETPPSLVVASKKKTEGWRERLVIGESKGTPKDKRGRVQMAIDGMVEKVKSS